VIAFPTRLMTSLLAYPSHRIIRKVQSLHLDDRGSRVRFLEGAGNFSLYRRVQGGPGVKRPKREADHSPPSSSEVKESVELYLHSPIRLHGVLFI